MLTERQKEIYSEAGCLRLPGVFDLGLADRVADRAWTFLEEERGVRRDDPETWGIDAPFVGLKALRLEEPYRSLQSPELKAAIDDLLGAGGWHEPKDWGGFLVSFPDHRPAEWCLPKRGWHVDYHFTHEPDEAFGVRVFTFLSEVGPRGGGTLVVRGSHRLVERFVRSLTPDERRLKYAELRERFCSSFPWLEELTTLGATDPARIRFYMERTHHEAGVQLRVEELCGTPGDVILTHPWIVHVTAPNAGPAPRFMLGKNVYAAPGVLHR